jgi:uncharacterized protein YggE
MGFGGLATSPLLAQEETRAYVTVAANGAVTNTPDRARIQLSVETRAATASVAVQENAARQSAVIQALRKLGIRDNRISTEGYAVMPETRTGKEDQTPRIVSYLVSNTIAVSLDSASGVGKVLDTAIESGANSVSSISFYLADAEGAYQQAIASAVKNAHDQALVMAQAAGGRLGPLVELTTTSQNRPSPVARAERFMGMAAASTPVMAGEQTTSASVTGKWVFIQNR